MEQQVAPPRTVGFWGSSLFQINVSAARTYMFMGNLALTLSASMHMTESSMLCCLPWSTCAMFEVIASKHPGALRREE